MYAGQRLAFVRVRCIAEPQGTAAIGRHAADADDVPEGMQAQREAEQAQDLNEVSSFADGTHASIVNAVDAVCGACSSWMHHWAEADRRCFTLDATCSCRSRQGRA